MTEPDEAIPPPDPEPLPLNYVETREAPVPAATEGSRWFAYIAVGLTALALLLGVAMMVGFVFLMLRGW